MPSPHSCCAQQVRLQGRRDPVEHLSPTALVMGCTAADQRRQLSGVCSLCRARNRREGRGACRWLYHQTCPAKLCQRSRGASSRRRWGSAVLYVYDLRTWFTLELAGGSGGGALQQIEWFPRIQRSAPVCVPVIVVVSRWVSGQEDSTWAAADAGTAPTQAQKLAQASCSGGQCLNIWDVVHGTQVYSSGGRAGTGRR